MGNAYPKNGAPISEGMQKYYETLGKMTQAEADNLIRGIAPYTD